MEDVLEGAWMPPGALLALEGAVVRGAEFITGNADDPLAKELVLPVLSLFLFLLAAQLALVGLCHAVSVLAGCLFGGEEGHLPLAQSSKVARSILQLSFMSWASYQGILALESAGGWAALVTSGSSTSAAVLRMGMLLPLSKTICMAQAGYELYNVIDAYLFGTWVYVAHHLVAFACGALAVVYTYCQLYGIFFLGLSEVSTAVLCIVVLFETDQGQGVAGWNERYPVFRLAIGGVFVVLFTVFRLILWPWVSWHFWVDSLGVLAAETKDESMVSVEHPFAVVMFYLACNVALTLLQAVWGAEILKTSAQALGLLAAPKEKSA